MSNLPIYESLIVKRIKATLIDDVTCDCCNNRGLIRIEVSKRGKNKVQKANNDRNYGRPLKIKKHINLCKEHYEALSNILNYFEV